MSRSLRSREAAGSPPESQSTDPSLTAFSSNLPGLFPEQSPGTATDGYRLRLANLRLARLWVSAAPGATILELTTVSALKCLPPFALPLDGEAPSAPWIHRRGTLVQAAPVGAASDCLRFGLGGLPPTPITSSTTPATSSPSGQPVWVASGEVYTKSWPTLYAEPPIVRRLAALHHDAQAVHETWEKFVEEESGLGSSP